MKLGLGISHIYMHHTERTSNSREEENSWLVLGLDVVPVQADVTSITHYHLLSVREGETALN